MDTRTLQTFLRVYDLGSFTKAAAELGYAQSTVTAQIQQLEQELGWPLPRPHPRQPQRQMGSWEPGRDLGVRDTVPSGPSRAGGQQAWLMVLPPGAPFLGSVSPSVTRSRQRL